MVCWIESYHIRCISILSGKYLSLLQINSRFTHHFHELSSSLMQYWSRGDSRNQNINKRLVIYRYLCYNYEKTILSDRRVLKQPTIKCKETNFLALLGSDLSVNCSLDLGWGPVNMLDFSIFLVSLRIFFYLFCLFFAKVAWLKVSFNPASNMDTQSCAGFVVTLCFIYGRSSKKLWIPNFLSFRFDPTWNETPGLIL